MQRTEGLGQGRSSLKVSLAIEATVVEITTRQACGSTTRLRSGRHSETVKQFSNIAG